jgi:hypothetical protein
MFAPSAADLLAKVVDRDSFIAFVTALAAERQSAEELEKDNPERYRWAPARDWNNGTISSFLYAALAYFRGGPFHKPEEVPSWKMFAEFLYFGKIYE